MTRNLFFVLFNILEDGDIQAWYYNEVFIM